MKECKKIRDYRKVERKGIVKPESQDISVVHILRSSLDECVEELAVRDAAVEVDVELSEQVVQVLRGQRVRPQLGLEDAHEVGRLEEAVVVRVELLERRPQAPELPQQLLASERREKRVEHMTRE